MRYLTLCIAAGFAISLQSSLLAKGTAKYLLKSQQAAGNSTLVSVQLEVGGDLISLDEKTQEKKLPMRVAGDLEYRELVVACSDDVVRSLRHYDRAIAKIDVDGKGIEKRLPKEQELVAADLREGLFTMNGCNSPLTREQLDLIEVVGNSLAIDQLLPGRDVAKGEKWQHENSVIGALLGMDHVAVCEVDSIIVGASKGQVQIKLSGTVHGTIDGSTTEIELRGGYLFHQKLGRITKFNLAIQEKRAAGGVIPGLDVVAKAKVVITPASSETPFDDALIEQISDVSQELRTTLQYDASKRGFRFQHEPNWYVTGEQRDLLSLRCLQGSDWTSHCNVTTLPPRSEGRSTTLEQFQNDIRDSLGKNLEEISAATQWTTSQGHDCLGVIANGKVQDVEMQWRYYLVSSPGMPRVTLAATVEKSQLERFADADRELVESLQLLPIEVAKSVEKATK